MEVLKLRVIQTYRDRRYSDVLSLFDECKTLCDGCDHPVADLTDIQALTDIAKGVTAERNDDFKMAAIQFEGAKEGRKKALMELNQSDLTDRANISSFKSSVLNHEYEAAKTSLKNCTRDCNLLFAALDSLTGDPVDSMGKGDINDLPGISAGAVRVLKQFVEVRVSDDQASAEDLIRAIQRI